MLLEPPTHAALQPRAELHEGVEPLPGIRNHQFGRRRGGGRAHVRGKIGDGEVDFMADAGDDRDGRGHDGARQALIVECPEVFQGPAAPGQDQDLALGAAAGELECRNDLHRRLRALHRYRIDQHGRRGKAPRQHMQDVADRRPGGRGDDADALRKLGRGRLRSAANSPSSASLALSSSNCRFSAPRPASSI